MFRTWIECAASVSDERFADYWYTGQRFADYIGTAESGLAMAPSQGENPQTCGALRLSPHPHASSPMSVQLYWSPLSQPSRAVHWFMLLNDIKFDSHMIKNFPADMHTPEFKAMNPFSTVPTIKVKVYLLRLHHSLTRSRMLMARLFTSLTPSPTTSVRSTMIRSGSITWPAF